MPGITFVTPTFRNDIERFCLLRESMEKCNIDIPHVAVVHHEDLSIFKKIPYQSNLTFLSTRDVLPMSLEKRRTAKEYSRKDIRYYLFPRPLSGWWTQQIVKLLSPAFTETEAIVCLDSDIFFIKQVRSDDFYGLDGRLYLYEKDEACEPNATWLAGSLNFLSVEYEGPKNYVHALVPFHRKVILELQSFIENRYQAKWTQVMLDRKVTEYTTYGVYARYIHGCKLVVPHYPRLSIDYWLPEQTTEAHFQKDLINRIETSSAKAVLITSKTSLPVSSYRQIMLKVKVTSNGGMNNLRNRSTI